MPGPAMRDPTPTWLRPSVVTGRKQGEARTVEPAIYKAIQMLAGLIGADDPQSQVMGLATTSVPTGKIAEAVAKLTGKGPIKAYHGSPHDFDKFSSANIGTGEGAQAYGHGLYFAEKEGTARGYQQNLSTPTVEIMGQQMPVPTWSGNLSPQPRLIRRLADMRQKNPSGTEADVVWAVRHGIKQELKYSVLDDAGRNALLSQLDILATAEQRGIKTATGRMYEVNINADPESFLDWDAPLSQQSETVRRAMQARGVTPGVTATGAIHDPPGSVAYDALGRQVGTNAGAIPEWARSAPNRVAATEALREAGIPGIKYLDQGSRSAGEGTRNFVVFDDAIVEIMRKYGMLPPAIAGGYAASEER